MQTQIEKWSDGAVVRIPATVMVAASMSVGQVVEVREQNGRIVIEPVGALTYTLEELLRRMTPETF